MAVWVRGDAERVLEAKRGALVRNWMRFMTTALCGLGSAASSIYSQVSSEDARGKMSMTNTTWASSDVSQLRHQFANTDRKSVV